MHEVLINRLGDLSLPRKSVVKLTDRRDMTLDVYRGRKTTTQQQQQSSFYGCQAFLSGFTEIAMSFKLTVQALFVSFELGLRCLLLTFVWDVRLRDLLIFYLRILVFQF